jgi:hypothetical protein
MCALSSSVHYYDYIDYTFIMSTGQEGLREHIGGPAILKCKIFFAWRS